MRKLTSILILSILITSKLLSNEFNLFIQSSLPETHLNSPTNPNYEFSLFKNRNITISSYFIPSKFGLKELSTVGIFASLPIFENSILSISGKGFGESRFQQSSLAINWANDFDGQFFLKLGITFHNFVVYRYNSYQKVSFNLGAKIPVFSFFNIGVTLDNVNRAYYEKDDFIQQTGILTFGFVILDNLFIDVNNYLNFNQNYSFGLITSYELIKYFKVRMAFANKPVKYGIGTQLNIYDYGKIGLDYCFINDFGYVSYYFISILL